MAPALIGLRRALAVRRTRSVTSPTVRSRSPAWPDRAGTRPGAPPPAVEFRSWNSVVWATRHPAPTSAEHAAGPHSGAGQEHLAERAAAVHLLERPGLDAGLVHVDEEVREALVLGQAGIGPGQQHAEVGGVRAGVPHLLAVNHPFVAIGDRAGADAGQVGAGAGLAEQLAPGRLAERDREHEPGDLLRRAVLEQGRRGESRRDVPGRRADDPVGGQHAGDGPGFARRTRRGRRGPPATRGTRSPLPRACATTRGPSARRPSWRR